MHFFRRQKVNTDTKLSGKTIILQQMPRKGLLFKSLQYEKNKLKRQWRWNKQSTEEGTKTKTTWLYERNPYNSYKEPKENFIETTLHINGKKPNCWGLLHNRLNINPKTQKNLRFLSPLIKLTTNDHDIYKRDINFWKLWKRPRDKH